MAKVIVIYESKYGNTKLVAEEIVEGMREVEGIEVALSELKEVDLDKILDYHAILIGSPNHFGGPTRSIKKFIDRLGKLTLKKRVFAVFDTYIKRDLEKAVKKMEKRIKEKVPESKLLVPGLSIKIQGMKGPILEEDLPRCKEFGSKIAAQLKT
ncbi:FprA family A-type flavoprotein [Candidatus Bathyarchaeota archaeon]|nr:FprA family A-type flavoprotein [Candidatus Bathyarchaeota archaeon]